MASIVCTLFENHYHFGVAALSNSLFSRGFRGSIYAGYRGSLPKWAQKARSNKGLEWTGATTLKVSEGLDIHFLPLKTDHHLTNYKPDFMVDLLQGPANGADAIFYFDPDIVVNAAWSSFEKWVVCGVAVCEDVNSPMSENHPRRVAWRAYYGKKGIRLFFKDPIYINGGFVGVNAGSFRFLTLWKRLQDEMAPVIGGLGRSSLNGNTLPREARDEFDPFPKTDQDALNAAIEAWGGEISFIGKEGMSFKQGASLMSHALGSPKPWQRNLLLRMVKGFPPGLADRNYWKYSKGPINSHSAGLIRFQIVSLALATAIGRFYRRTIY